MGKKDKGGDSDGAKSDAAENIKVVVRCRPLSSKEIESGYKSCVDLDLTEGTVTVNTLCGNPDRWTFDGVINNTYTQKDVFTQFVRPMVDSVLEGFNATVFAYGQSGSGKTHTMTGKMGDPELEGIIPRTFAYIFSMLRQFHETTPNKKFSLYVSFIELYNGKTRDLLAKQQVPLAVKENKDKTFYVQGAHFPQVKTPEDILLLMEEGTERRQVAATELNADSSRSHSIFTLAVECTETSDDGDVRSVTSKLNLVDLAGSERQSKTGATGDTLKEGCNINLSLSALGTVIDTLVKGKGHVPFRSSPLTMLLKDSLGGSSKTAMFANIGPSEHNVSETISTLRFADRAKQIKNKPVVNMDTKDQKIAELSELVAELKEKLKQFESGGMKQLEEELESLRERVGELEVELDNALKGREADAVDFANSKNQANAEKALLEQAVQEASEELERLRGDVMMSESAARDEQRQREEILAICTEYLVMNAGSDNNNSEATKRAPIRDADDLARILRDRSHGASGAELAKAQSNYHNLEAEKRAMLQEHESRAMQLQHELDATKAELVAVSKKFKKAKDLLYEEREARKQLAVMHSSGQQQQQSDASPIRRTLSVSGTDDGGATTTTVAATSSAVLMNSIAVEEGVSWRQQRHELECRHKEEVSALQEQIAALYESQENSERVVALEDEMSRQRESFELHITSLQEELAALREASASVLEANDNDSVLVQQLKHIVKTQQDAATKSREHILSLETLVESLKENQYAMEKHYALRQSTSRNGATGSAGQRAGAAAAPPPGKPRRSGRSSNRDRQQAESREHEQQEAAVSVGESTPKDAALSLDILETQMHREERNLLRHALDVTATQRNQLLDNLLHQQTGAQGSNDEAQRDVDTQEALRAIKEENELLRKQFLEASKALDDRRTDAIIEAVQKQRQDVAVVEQASDQTTENLNLKATVMNLQGTLQRVRTEAAEKEKTLMLALEKYAQGAASKSKKQRASSNKSDSAGDAAASAVLNGDQHSTTAETSTTQRIPSTPNGDSETGSAHLHAGQFLSAGDVLDGSPDGGDIIESPMKSIIDMLQQDKAQLLETIGRMERELLLRSVESNTTPGDATAVAVSGSANDTTPPQLQRSGSLALLFEEEQRRAASENTELRHRSTMLEVEHSQMSRDVDALKSELEEERERRHAMETEMNELVETVKRVKAQLSDREKRCTHMENQLNEQQAEMARVVQDAAEHTSQVVDLERRLAERSSQLSDLRATMQQQKELMAKAQERTDEAVAAAKALKKQLSEKDRAHADMLREREEAVLKATNRRIEALAEEHQRDLTRKDEDAQKLRKKIRKLEASLQKSKEKFDEKVCELDELFKLLEEQKVDAMRLLLKQSGQTEKQEELYVQDQQEQIQSTLQRAKEEQRRKRDKFSMGENTSALSQVRAAGNAINLVKKMGQVVTYPPGTSTGGSDNNNDFGGSSSGRGRRGTMQQRFDDDDDEY